MNYLVCKQPVIGENQANGLWGMRDSNARVEKCGTDSVSGTGESTFERPKVQR